MIVIEYKSTDKESHKSETNIQNEDQQYEFIVFFIQVRMQL